MAPLSVVDPYGVTPAWMTSALRCAGFDVDVESLDVNAVGVGQVGETYRFKIVYAGTPPEDAPRTIIGKFHSADENSRAIAQQLNLYRQEYMFYRELAASTQAAVPKPYLVLNDDEDRFVMRSRGSRGFPLSSRRVSTSSCGIGVFDPATLC